MGNYDLFNRKHGEIFFDPITIPENGVVFLLCWWSQSRMFLQYLCTISNDYKDTPLYVYNIEGFIYKGFEQRYNIKSHGMGETFWIKNSHIVGRIVNYEIEKVNVRTYFDLLKG
jgi:hypothetical protein